MKAYRDEITGRWHSDLPDVFDLMCEKLRKREPFSFARYGDGEWNAIYGKKGANCDGHEYFPDMGERLRRIVKKRSEASIDAKATIQPVADKCNVTKEELSAASALNTNYFFGMQPLTVASEKILQIEKDFPGIDWVDADSIHNASIDGRLDELFGCLQFSMVVLVGPRHLSSLGHRFKHFRQWTIPERNCWGDFNDTVVAISSSISVSITKNVKPLVFLLCASMMSEIIVDQFYGYGHTFIDMGSVLDPYAGVRSRRYHHKLNINANM